MDKPTPEQIEGANEIISHLNQLSELAGIKLSFQSEEGIATDIRWEDDSKKVIVVYAYKND